MTKSCIQKDLIQGFLSWVQSQCANHYTMEPSVIAIIFEMDPSLCIIAFVEYTEFSEFIRVFLKIDYLFVDVNKFE